MKVLRFFRSRRVIRQASQLINTSYQVQQHLAGRAPPPDAGRILVLKLWRTAPELAQSPALLPTPVLLAAGALVEAIHHARRLGDRLEVEALNSTLLTLWISGVHQLPTAPPSPLDARLFLQSWDMVQGLWAREPD